MKKLICILTLFVMTIATPCNIVSANCKSSVISVTKEYLEDGSYLLITVSEDTPIASYSTTSSKSGAKSTSYVSSDGIVQWSFTVHGTFQLNPGVSVSCNASSYSYNISNSSWHLESASASYSGNQACASATFNKKVLFIKTDTVNANVTLTCDVNGNLS